jgi:hypothetical protein
MHLIIIKKKLKNLFEIALRNTVFKVRNNFLAKLYF